MNEAARIRRELAELEMRNSRRSAELRLADLRDEVLVARKSINSCQILRANSDSVADRVAYQDAIDDMERRNVDKVEEITILIDRLYEMDPNWVYQNPHWEDADQDDKDKGEVEDTDEEEEGSD